MGLNAGELDREITLQTATKTQDSESGEEVIDWDTADEETIWAQWLPAGSREAWQAGQRLQAYVDGVLRIYYRDEPDPALNRVVFEGKSYDIKGAVEIERREGWELAVVARNE